MSPYQRSFKDNPLLIDSLFNLLETSFPGITKFKEASEALGVKWEPGSTPFVLFQDELAISHVGVLEVPLTIFNAPITVSALHAVCTRPEYRRQGYSHQLMVDAIQFCATRHETTILYTGKPYLYARFGFRAIQEHRFKVKPPAQGNRESFRLLDKKNSNDVQIIHRLLETRVPVSNILGVRSEKGIFCFNEGTQPLYFSEDLDLMISVERKDSQLHLYDMIGPKLYPLAELIRHFQGPFEEVYIYFNPDQLEVNAHAEPYIVNGDTLMVKGPFAVEGSAFMVPRTSRC